MSAKSARAIFLRAALIVLAAGYAAAQSTAPTAFVRSDDEKGLSGLQLLGKRVFEDRNLSEPRGLSCMSCHAPQRAFQGNNGSPIAAVAAGSSPDKLGRRKTPTIMYNPHSPDDARICGS